MKPLGAVLETALSRLELGEVALEVRAIALWPQVVGETMADATEALRVRNGTLHVAARSSVWSQELGFHRRAILRKYREALGTEFIRDVRANVGPVRGRSTGAAVRFPETEVRRQRLPEAEVARISAAAEGCGDPELAQAIRRALTLEAQLQQWRLQHGARACPLCRAAFSSPHDACPACRQDERST